MIPLDWDYERDREKELHRKFLQALRMKKRSIKRTWMQVTSVANGQSLFLLPYHSMLTHVEKLMEERKHRLLEIAKSNTAAVTLNDLDIKWMQIVVLEKPSSSVKVIINDKF